MCSFQPVDQTKEIIARGLRQLPQSELLWIKAASLEKKLEDKKIVFEKALIQIPTSVHFWKAVASLETDTDKQISKLKEAIQHCGRNREVTQNIWAFI